MTAIIKLLPYILTGVIAFVAGLILQAKVLSETPDCICNPPAVKCPDNVSIEPIHQAFRETLM